MRWLGGETWGTCPHGTCPNGSKRPSQFPNLPGCPPAEATLRHRSAREDSPWLLPSDDRLPNNPTHFTRPSSIISIPQTAAPGHCWLSTRSSNRRDLAPRHRLHSAPRSHPSFNPASTAAPASSSHQRTGACSWGEEAQLKK
jgi:hypothetical protein